MPGYVVSPAQGLSELGLLSTNTVPLFIRIHNRCFYFSVKREPKEEPSSPLEATSPGSILRNNGEFVLKSNYMHDNCARYSTQHWTNVQVTIQE